MNPAAKDIAHLSPQEKRALLVALLKKKAEQSRPRPPVNQSPPARLDSIAAHVSDLNAEAILDPGIQAAAAPAGPIGEPDNIFLTGVTGFLGAFLLHELLRATQADLYCLVRCASVEEGRARIEDRLESYVPRNGHDRSRIIPVPGDLSEPRLGLSTEQIQTLADTIDTIYHSGAAVNWIFPYDRLKPANVLGTQEVLRLACQARTKPVHFISSLSVFPLFSDHDDEARVVYEADSLDHGGVLYSGYTQSKWVAEKMVVIARSRGLPVAVYRPGLIVGHSQTGVWNTDDVTSRMMKSWIELGYAPDLDAATDMTPVDYVSRAIAHLSRSPQSIGQVFHLANSQPVHVRDLVDWIRSFGYPVESIPYDRWRSELIDLATRSRENAAHSLAPLFSVSLADDAPSARPDQADTLDVLGTIIVASYASSSVRFDCRNTLAGLADSSIACPPVDGNLLRVYLDYFVRSAFVDAPPAGKTVKRQPSA